MLKTIFLYGCLLAILFCLLALAQYFFWVKMHNAELYISLIAIIFLSLGLWFGKKTQPQLPLGRVVEVPIYENFKFIPTNGFGISKRELEVLQLVGKGLSNKQIADNLFVSVATIKTHTSNIFEKMEVKNRIEAIVKAKESGIIF